MISAGNHDPKDAVTLSPAQIKMILQADEAFQNGEKAFSSEEVLDRARAKVEEWTTILPSQSA